MKIPDCVMEWDGTKAERLEVLEVSMFQIQTACFPDMKQRDFNRLFVEAFSRNVVQSELIRMMQDIMEEGQE